MLSLLSKVNADDHDKGRVSDRVTNIVQECAEVALDVQPGRQHAVQIVHEVVVDDQGDQVLVRMFPKEDADWKHAKNRYDVRQVLQKSVSLCFFHRHSRTWASKLSFYAMWSHERPLDAIGESG